MRFFLMKGDKSRCVYNTTCVSVEREMRRCIRIYTFNSENDGYLLQKEKVSSSPSQSIAPPLRGLCRPYYDSLPMRARERALAGSGPVRFVSCFFDNCFCSNPSTRFDSMNRRGGNTIRGRSLR
mmetsp:Transcript_20252/g.42083  ORF Transcript_20252/g.42083 Transcript_20252/m.42083 type:complete len:124 (+) Transcript_20252:121-492(+)